MYIVIVIIDVDHVPHFRTFRNGPIDSLLEVPLRGEIVNPDSKNGSHLDHLEQVVPKYGDLGINEGLGIEGFYGGKIARSIRSKVNI